MSFWKSIGKAVGGFLGGASGSSLIGAAGNIVGSLIGAKSTSDTNSANMRLAEYQYSKDLEMWNRQNAYNTPAAQMQRYKDAGLNPHLIYSQGNPGNASSAPSYSAPTIQSNAEQYNRMGAAVGSALGQYQNYKLMQQQIATQQAQQDNLTAQAAYTRARATSELFNRALTAAKTSGIRASLPFLSDYYRLRNDNLQQDANNKVIQAGLLAQQADFLDQRIRDAKRRNDNLELMELQMMKADLSMKIWAAKNSRQNYMFNKSVNPFRKSILKAQDRRSWHDSDIRFYERNYLQRNGRYVPRSASSTYEALSILMGQSDSDYMYSIY